MEKCNRFLLAIWFALGASLLAVMPASAQNEDIEAQIKALEAEVQKIEPLKEQIERLIREAGYEPHQRDNWYRLLN